MCQMNKVNGIQKNLEAVNQLKFSYLRTVFKGVTRASLFRSTVAEKYSSFLDFIMTSCAGYSVTISSHILA